MAHLVKKLVLAASAAAMVAVPASARGGWGGGRHHDGIDAGDVIAGALVIGGIAAIASAASSNGRGRGYGSSRGYDRYDGGYNNNGYGSRTAVDQCVRAAQREASRYGGWARVTDVSSIDRVRGGYEVRGRLVVENDRYRGNWRGGRDRYGYSYDRYGNDYDKGRFTCEARYGGIEDVRVSGLRDNRW